MVSCRLVPFIFANLLLAAAATAATMQAAVALRDGAHDFDFGRGTWKIHIHRLLHPLTGSAQWVDYDGSKTDVPIWNGKANVAEVKADGPAGHLDFIALRLYDPVAHQWSLNFTTIGNGNFGMPLYGEKRGRQLEFICPARFSTRKITTVAPFLSASCGRTSRPIPIISNRRSRPISARRGRPTSSPI